MGPDLQVLELIADWRDDLSARLARARLRIELAGLEQHQVDELAAEVTAFSEVCLIIRELAR